ncbi:hypothetical protein [Modestobacter excelsi]|uniref:hypothetical protein n=1 Tax=Modestobacter excelsi TaxID=2213161 RepID=UPI00110D019E|nr:hypothetical protein [Modestobacter excelsi]
MTDLTTARGAELREPDPVPGLADRDVRPAAGPAAAPDGVELTRLLALARLTAPQALELAAGLLAETAGQDDPAGPDRALVGTDGRVVLGPAPGGGGIGSPSDGTGAGEALATVLAEVAGAARLRGRPADPAAEELLTELDRAAGDLPDAGVPAVAARLQETVAGIDRAAVRRELAALVRAVDDRTASATGPARAGSGSPRARTVAAGRVPSGGSRTTMRRIGMWLFSVVVLAAGVVVEVAFLRDDIGADIELLLDAGRSGSASSTAPEPDGLPIAPPAPAAAGSVAAVDLRPLAQCAPAAPCTLRVLVRLVPGPDPQTVTWSYRLVDRCTGTATTVPGGTVTVPAGGQQAAAVGTVALPDQRSVAVVAVTSSPATAASAPVSAGSCLTDRPDGTG